MKFPWLSIIVSLGCLLPAAHGAPAFSNLHAFSVLPHGANPEAPLVQASDGNFYGTTAYGGTNGGNGTVFRITPDGTLTTLYSFSGGSDGATPLAGLIQATDGNLYGTTAYGGDANGDGTIFRISTNGVFSTLYVFTGGSDSANPWAGLVQASDGNFYGTTSGYLDNGIIFRITTNGTLTTLYSFTGGSDGATPLAGLVQASDGNLYGTTAYGGDANSDGTIFRITTNGAFSTVYVFTGGGDSSSPEAPVMQARDGNLYGTTSGYFDNGSVFQVTTNGTLTTLYSFSGGSDGATPLAGMVQASDGNLYGTTAYGGDANGDGTLFRITTGGALTTLHNFTGGTDGATSFASLIQAGDGNLYGTTGYGGTNNAGTLFKVSTAGAYATWHLFAGDVDGQFPSADLVRGRDGNLYGTTENGGATGNGVVFVATPNGAVTLLPSFGTITNTSTSALLDGTFPEGALVQGNDGNFYGTASSDGAYGYGTVFSLTPNGVFTELYSFGAVTDGSGTPLDGSSPWAGLVQGQDGDFYGTTVAGGASDYGTVFRINTNGTFTTLYPFTDGSDGGSPYCTLVQGSDGNLYGTCSSGGAYGNGTVFQMSTNGALSTLYSFTGGSDGADPEAGLVQGTDGWLYGTTAGGGTGNGTVFRISTGGAFVSLAQFNGANGASPLAPLVEGQDGNFCGTTSAGGSKGDGTVFQVTTNGNLTLLWDLSGGNDGANPDAGLVAGSNGTLYGVTENGGGGGMGNLFRLSLAPILQSPTRNNAAFNFSWGAVVGLNYQIQFKTNLAQTAWADLGSALAATNGTVQVSDPIGPGPQRFYRVLLLP
jgi:uncharacterized repeat protein (TIGR03803 family)